MFLVEKFVSTRPIYLVTPTHCDDEILLDALVKAYKTFKEEYCEAHSVPGASVVELKDLDGFPHKVDSDVQHEKKDPQQQNDEK